MLNKIQQWKCNIFFLSPHVLLYLTNTSSISHAISRLMNFTLPLLHLIMDYQSSLRIPSRDLGSVPAWFLETSCRINHTNSLCLTVCPRHKTFEIQQRNSTPAHSLTFKAAAAAECGAVGPHRLQKMSFQFIVHSRGFKVHNMLILNDLLEDK